MLYFMNVLKRLTRNSCTESISLSSGDQSIYIHAENEVSYPVFKIILFFYNKQTEKCCAISKKWTLFNDLYKKAFFLLTMAEKLSIIVIVVTEEYPSLVEGVGLENRKGCQSLRGFESLFLLHFNK